MSHSHISVLPSVPTSEERQLIYPFSELDATEAYPGLEEFQVVLSEDGRGAGVRARYGFRRGQMIARVTGHLVPRRALHTLQITPNVHLFDPHFTGLFLHACNPNVFLDMREFEVWALRDIEAGEFITMDYSVTEDILSRQFRCLCGAPECRTWITGRREAINEEGRLLLNSIKRARLQNPA